MLFGGSHFAILGCEQSLMKPTKERDGAVGRKANSKPKVLAVASSGGHWVQLRRLRPAWDECAVTYVTTEPEYRHEVSKDSDSAGDTSPGFHIVPDANQWTKVRLVYLFFSIAALVVRVRPDAIVTTGAAPGLFALWIGKLLGARTIWVDSVANTETLSLSGRLVKNAADLWLTQWEHVADANADQAGPTYRGAVF